VPKALVVDDSRAIRIILTEMLEQLGYTVSSASNGKLAAETLACTPDEGIPELALVDWNMPDMNGIELVQHVRANSRYNHMQLVMVTTETQPEQMAAALTAGANEYVMKPFTADMIREKLLLIGALQMPGEKE
jgi:two-component system chemotaxis response regulator CheY